MNAFRSLASAGWTSTKITMTDIPVNKAQLYGRVSDFDGGATAAWMADLSKKREGLTWRAVRDAHTGHSIHCVSPRSHEALTADLRLGLRILGWMTTKTPVTWYWWDQDWPRVLPADAIPNKTHLNGGWAIPGVPEVHVYRREEAHKVMIHESIHALSLDVPHRLIDPIRVRFEADLGRSLWPHLGECFTELYAEWLWSVVTGRPWSEQLVCSEGQAAVIWKRIRGLTEAEDTNVFAYYILKWVLMQHIEAVLLAPTVSAPKWFGWWLAAKPYLNQLADSTKELDVDYPMGMTCRSS
jgi:hypothetical protein